MEEQSTSAEYLCTLQPPKGSPLASLLAELRKKWFNEHGGMDTTGLYPPHVSVTGFFTATSQQVARICKAATKLIAVQAEAGFHIEMRDVISTDTGYVIIDVFAPEVAAFAVSLTDQAGTFGVRMRPKDVRHLSLASGRSLAEQSRIKQLCSILPHGLCTLDFVVASLVHRSDVTRRDCNGEAKPHTFRELLRLRLPGDAMAGANEFFWPRSILLSAREPSSKQTPSAVASTATPMKRRACEWISQDGSNGDCREERQWSPALLPTILGHEVTPTKICKKADESFVIAPMLVAPKVEPGDSDSKIDSSRTKLVIAGW